MNMIILILLFLIESSFLQAMEREPGEPFTPQYDIISRPQIYEKVPLRNFAAAFSTQLNCWEDEKGNLEIAAVTVSDKPHLEGWERCAVISNSGEEVYLHQRSSRPALLENKKHLKSRAKLLSDFSSPPRLFSVFIDLENKLMEGGAPYLGSAIADIKRDISEADMVIFLIGAGISSSLVPDLLSYYQQLDLTITPSTDKATTSSYLKFCNRLIEDKEYRNSIIKIHQQFAFLLSSKNNGFEPTVAHYALAKLVLFLKEQGKEVRVFSANVDDLEKKAGIKLDEEKDCVTNRARSKIPEASEFAQKKSVIICIGKSSDHGGDLSYIYKNSITAESPPHFYTFNKSDKPLIGYEVDDFDNIINTFVLPMTLIQGDIQVTLPKLSEALIP